MTIPHPQTPAPDAMIHLHRLFCSARAAEQLAEDTEEYALWDRAAKATKAASDHLLAARATSLADLLRQASVLTWIYQHDESGPNVLEAYGDVVEIVAIRSVLGGLFDLMPQTKEFGADWPKPSRALLDSYAEWLAREQGLLSLEMDGTLDVREDGASCRAAIVLAALGLDG